MSDAPKSPASTLKSINDGEPCILCNVFVTEGVFEYGDQWERGAREGLWRQHPLQEIVASANAGCRFCSYVLQSLRLTDYGTRDYYASRSSADQQTSQGCNETPEERRSIEENKKSAQTVYFFAQKGGAIRVRDNSDPDDHGRWKGPPWAVIYAAVGMSWRLSGPRSPSVPAFMACCFSVGV